jgi:hypothetical protein
MGKIVAKKAGHNGHAGDLRVLSMGSWLRQ